MGVPIQYTSHPRPPPQKRQRPKRVVEVGYPDIKTETPIPLGGTMFEVEVFEVIGWPQRDFA